MLPPYRRPMYDDSSAVARQSSLIRQKGAIEAEGASRRGAIIGQGIGQVADIAGRTLGQLAQITADEPRRKYEEGQRSRVEREQRRGDNLRGLESMLADLPIGEAAQVMRREGFTKEADALLTKARETALDAIEMEGKRRQITAARIGEAAELFGSLQGIADPGMRDAQYEALVPKVRELVGGLGKNVPDQYDEGFVSQAVQWGMTAKEKLALQATALKEARDAAKDARDGHEAALALLGRLLPEADSQDEWGQALSAAEALGAPKETIGIFGREYSPEAAQRAASISQKGPNEPAVGSEGDFLVSFAKSKGKSVNDLTPSERLQARRQFQSAGWKPDSPDTPAGAKMLSPESYAAASRWKSGELAKLEVQRREGVLSPEDHEAAKARIQDDFLDQIGANRRPGRTLADVGRGAPPASAPPSAGRPPAAAPPMAGSRGVAVPPEVASVLRSVPPGRHELSDGSVWLVYPDGRITPGQ